MSDLFLDLPLPRVLSLPPFPFPFCFGELRHEPLGVVPSSSPSQSSMSCKDGNPVLSELDQVRAFCNLLAALTSSSTNVEPLNWVMTLVKSFGPSLRETAVPSFSIMPSR